MLIEDYISFIVSKRWQKVGDFVLKMPITAIEGITNYDDLIYNFVKYKTDTTEGFLVIESYEVDYNATDGETITIEGRDLLCILANRIVWGQFIQSSTTIKTIVDRLINTQVKNPTWMPNRALGDKFVIGLYTASDSIDARQFTGDNLFDAIISVCGDNYSPLIYWDKNVGTNGAYVFGLYHADSNIKAYFSEALGNLEELQMYFATQDFKNISLTAGEGEGIDRKSISYNLTGVPTKYQSQGINRKELFVDARNISSNNGEIGDTEYFEMLTAKGKEELEKSSIKRSITAKIDTSELVYGVGYNVGDLIQINYKDNVWRARITEYIICQDDNGYQEYPNFEIII